MSINGVSKSTCSLGRNHFYKRIHMVTWTLRVWGVQLKTICLIILARIIGDLVTCFLPAAQPQFHHLCCIGPRVQPGSSRLRLDMQGAPRPEKITWIKLKRGFEYRNFHTTSEPSKKERIARKSYGTVFLLSFGFL